MKIKITSSVKKVHFRYRPKSDDWIIEVNTAPIKFYSGYSGGDCTNYWSTLEMAIRFAKSKDLVPKCFKAEQLVDEVDEIEVSM